MIVSFYEMLGFYYELQTILSATVVALPHSWSNPLSSIVGVGGGGLLIYFNDHAIGSK